jgi:tetratricopeptide (TPR) repeat protein
MPATPSGLSPAEYHALDELAGRLRTAPSSVSAKDLRTVEALVGQHPELDGLKPFLEATLVRLALTLRSQGHRDAAEAHLRRASSLSPGSLAPRIALLDLLLEARDWAGAEATAREALALSPRDPEALERLAFALFRQDRNREAADVLRESLAIRDSPEARSLLARLEKEASDESGMTEQRLSHFNVRYDGEAHEEVGREVLRALERHYATLVATLDHEPRATIPVILFSQRAYYDASGAPPWSGGVYDNLDGRIRVPIGGLDAGLGPEMDGALIHELTHAFTAEITGSLTPSDVNEGLAQYMEGKRLESLLRADELHALAEGRIGGVAGTYMNALSFVEYLMVQRGQGGVNDLLRAMGETHDVEEAFRQVYGAGAQQVRLAWRTRLRQQYGG